METASADTKKWVAKRFGIPEEDVLWYHSGICYDRVGIKTKDSADRVSDQVKGGTVNGGQFDGMPLGNQSSTEGGFDIMC
jgi:hypothetical protein